MPKKIVLVTYGSLGDLRPYMAVGRELQRRGHAVTIAGSAHYEDEVKAAELNFVSVAPDLSAYLANTENLRKGLDRRNGTQFVVRDVFLRHLEESYEQLLRACDSADLIVSHVLGFAVPLAADTLKIPWFQTFLQPISLFSAYDPSVIPIAPFLTRLRIFGPGVMGLLMRAIKWKTRPWVEPVYEFRARLGLSPDATHPLMESYSPYGNMCWFSQLLAQSQPDWPPHTEITGFPFWDSEEFGLPSVEPELLEFLISQRPVTFTLGSTAVFEPGEFFRVSAEAAAEMGINALLVGCKDPTAHGTAWSGGKIKSIPFAPYSRVFPLSRAVVHHGGIGCVAESIRACKQMVVVPYSFDQPDNAERTKRLGVAAVVPRSKYRLEHLVPILQKVLSNRDGEQKAVELGKALSREHGTVRACEFVERRLTEIQAN